MCTLRQPTDTKRTASTGVPMFSAITHAKDQYASTTQETLAAALRSLEEPPEHNIFAELTELGLGRR